MVVVVVAAVAAGPARMSTFGIPEEKLGLKEVLGYMQGVLVRGV